jgi:hypothetical protein
MEQYYVEGLYVTQRGLRKAKRLSAVKLAQAEPFARSFWALSAQEALRMATEALEGGQWLEEPRVSQVSEEQRMRAMGAPELPGFGST